MRMLRPINVSDANISTSALPYCFMNRAFEAAGAFYISGERLGRMFSPKRRFSQICVDFVQEFLRCVGVCMKIRLSQVRMAGPLAHMRARQPAANASIEGIWSSRPSARGHRGRYAHLHIWEA